MEQSPSRVGTLREAKKKEKTFSDADIQAHQFLKEGLELRNKAVELLNNIHAIEETHEKKRRQHIQKSFPEAMHLFNQAIERFEKVLNLQPQHFLASYYLAFTLYSKARRYR
jgi:hypothetical protein